MEDFLTLVKKCKSGIRIRQGPGVYYIDNSIYYLLISYHCRRGYHWFQTIDTNDFARN